MTTLIKNIQLIDGSGRPGARTDLLIKGKLISAIGNLSKYRAEETIDGLGAILSPGFIDLHSNIDHYLGISKEDPQKKLLLSGVTTAIGGQDGVSLAPLIYGSLEAASSWTCGKGVNINWRTMREFLKIFSQKKLFINFGTFAGYGTILSSVVKPASGEIHPNEFRVIRMMIERSLEEGALGISFDRAPFLNNLPHEELRKTLAIIARLNSVYSLRLPLDDERNINKIIYQTEQAGVKTVISHLEPTKENGSRYEKAVEEIAANAARTDILFEVYPRAYTLWNIDELWQILNSQKKFKGIDIAIISAPHHEYLEGRSLTFWSRARGLTLVQALDALKKLLGNNAVFSFKNVDEEKLIKTLTSDRSLVASLDGHSKNLENLPFPTFLSTIEKRKVIPVEKLIHKITGLPAQKLNLKKRGLIKTGNWADLVLWQGSKIYEVFVNGQRVVREGKVENIAAGEVLKRS
ncbi:hypothetical protein HYV91_00060 [Candidatus Wolfebacteria bacterium]|nr:hypothetical protein [Candidatus Wolfebacteria bacterium]